MAIGMIIGYIGGLYWGSQAVLLCFLCMVCIAIVMLLQCKLPILIKCLCFSINYLKSIIFILIIAIMANFYMQYTEAQYKQIDTEQQVKTSWKGVIVSGKVETKYKEQYIVRLTNGKKVYVYAKKGSTSFAFGDAVYIQGRYATMEGQKNPGGHNLRLQAKTNKIVGRVQAEKIEGIAHKQVGGVEYAIVSLRQYGLKRIQEKLPEEVYPIVQALILGDKTHIPEEVEEDFRNSSVSHMLAISGAHISYIILAIMTLERFTSKRWIQIFILVFLCFFSALVGGTPSVRRACMMTGMIMIARLLHRKSCIYTNMAVSILILGIENPYCLWDLGLQLSYAGTLGIVYGMPIFDIYPQMWINCGRQTGVYKETCKLCGKASAAYGNCQYCNSSLFNLSFSEYSRD